MGSSITKRCTRWVNLNMRGRRAGGGDARFMARKNRLRTAIYIGRSVRDLRVYQEICLSRNLTMSICDVQPDLPKQSAQARPELDLSRLPMPGQLLGRSMPVRTVRRPCGHLDHRARIADGLAGGNVERQGTFGTGRSAHADPEWVFHGARAAGLGCRPCSLERNRSCIRHLSYVTGTRSLNMQKPKRSKKGPEMRMDQLITVRLPSETMRALERWAKRGKITRAEAIRRLLNSALAASRAAAKL